MKGTNNKYKPLLSEVVEQQLGSIDNLQSWTLDKRYRRRSPERNSSSSSSSAIRQSSEFVQSELQRPASNSSRDRLPVLSPLTSITFIPSQSNHDEGKVSDIVPVDNKQQTSSILLAVLNFTNSIVGAGVIGLPFALRESGFWSGVGLIIVLAVIVDWTINLMMISSKLAGKQTYQGLVGYCFGRRGRLTVGLFQFLFAFGGMCAYVVIIGDTLPIVLRQLFAHSASVAAVLLLGRRAVIIWSTVFIILPLSLYRDVSKLAKASAAALLALLFIIITVAIKGPTMAAVGTTDGARNITVDLIRPGIFQSIGVISFAFVCHHNSFLIYGSLRRPTLDRWSSVTHWSTGISCFLSLAMGVAGYLSFGQQTQANILNNFGQDSSLMVALARLCFAANMFTTFPLELFVCREVLESYLFTGEGSQQTSLRVHFGLTAVLCAVPMTIALQTCNLGVLLELVGCFSATALAYILPPACYIHLASGRLMERKKLLPVLCMCLGVTVLLLSTSRTVYEAFYHHDDSPNGKDRQWQL